jgi:hypothetical protein
MAEKFLDASDALTSRMQSECQNLNFRSPLSRLFGLLPVPS